MRLLHLHLLLRQRFSLLLKPRSFLLDLGLSCALHHALFLLLLHEKLLLLLQMLCGNYRGRVRVHHRGRVIGWRNQTDARGLRNTKNGKTVWNAS
jgi:hypothetical protein